MMPRLIYLVGPPASGKTALMRRLTEPYERVTITGTPPGHGVSHDVLVDPGSGAPVAAEVGIQRGEFSGTDPLASAIIDKADPWVRTQPHTVLLGEGARLTLPRFFDAALDGGYAVVLVHLNHADAETWREARGRNESGLYVENRRYAAAKLAKELDARGGPVSVVEGHPDELFEPLRELMISDW